MTALVVGFDLDMTLIDARPGIAATYRALTASTGVHVDTDVVVARLGPPLREELAHWFPPDQVEDAVRRFRELYPEHATTRCRAMPGAHDAVAAVRQRHGRVMVVTSKLGRFARAHLDHLGIAVDEVVGDRFGDGKVAAITAGDAGVYVGDHVADMRAARKAGAVAVGVTTGPCPAPDLRSAGAHVVLPDLRSFPGWLASDGPAAVRDRDG